MPKLPVMRLARGLENTFRPHDLCSIDENYHSFVVAYSGEFKEHSHDADEFIYILEGRLQLEVDGETHTLRQGDAFLVPANTPHRPVAEHRTLALVVEKRGMQYGPGKQDG